MQELLDPVWLADLAFLVDTIKPLKALSISLQRREAGVSQLYAHIKAFGSKLQLFQRQRSQTELSTSYVPAAWGHGQFSTGWHWCQKEETCSSHRMSLFRDQWALSGFYCYWIGYVAFLPSFVLGPWRCPTSAEKCWAELEHELLAPTWHFTYFNHCSQSRPGLCTTVQILASPLSSVSVSCLSSEGHKLQSECFWVSSISQLHRAFKDL